MVTNKSEDKPHQFSLALHTGESKEKILQNRKDLLSLLDNDKEVHFIVANQTHSDHIKIIENSKTQGWEALADAIEDCDALITNKRGVVLTILTADCVPILLYDPKKKIVAVVHAGWKGTKLKIVAKTVKKMHEVFACEPKEIIAAVARQ